MKDQFTQGPLSVHDDYEVRTLDGRPIAEFLGHHTLPQEDRANAQLFAAAPDLLAALLDALFELESNYATYGYASTLVRINAANAAIRKATEPEA